MKNYPTIFRNVPNAKNITINHLLSHTSGLGDFVTKDDSLIYWLRKPVTEAEIFSEIKRQGSLFEPGTQTEYSNTGYYLLTRILEKKYKKEYKAIFNDNIVKPLQLKNTRSINKNDKGQDIATSYLFSDKWTPIEDFYFPNVIGVGDVVSTPEDMNAFLVALFSHKVISKESLEKMKPAENEDFGNGLMKLPFYSHPFYGHLGDTMGSHTMSLYNPVDGLTFTVMLTGMELNRNDYLIAILSIMYNMNYTLPDFNRYDAGALQLSSYEGVYAGTDLPLKVKIFVNDNVLNAQATGQQAFPLEAVGADKFRFIQAGIEMEFKNAEKTMILTQGGKKYVLKRE